MTARLTLDKAGRVVIPKPLRDELRLGVGDSLALEVVEGRITLRPLRSPAGLQKERGIWVHRTGQPLSSLVAGETTRLVREERDRRAMAKES
ncbi:MAG: AbrB/MazE/SpoVT family DNA-binding domain-containing protein [Bryobacterales bacterium]|nr:AbrB/MazE/SpoVT family DNA-binding domain-containing protein [Bryobacterales bacterium]